MAYIPYDLIPRQIKTIFQSHRQFHHAQIGRQVAAGLANLLQEEFAQFLAEQLQLAFIQFFDIFSGMYLIQNTAHVFTNSLVLQISGVITTARCKCPAAPLQQLPVVYAPEVLSVRLHSAFYVPESGHLEFLHVCPLHV